MRAKSTLKIFSFKKEPNKRYFFEIAASSKKDIESRRKRLLTKSEQNLSIEQGGQLLELTKDTKTKDVYDFLRNSSNQMKAMKRLKERSEKLQMNTDNLIRFVKCIWKLNNLLAYQKNIVYYFLMGCYLDKEENG